jgi:hypothetical protein
MSSQFVSFTMNCPPLIISAIVIFFLEKNRKDQEER